MPTRVKYGLIIAVLLVLGFAGYGIYKAQNYKASFVKEINPNLTDEDRSTFESRLTKVGEQLANAKTDEDKFGVYMQQGYNLQALGRLSDAEESFRQAIQVQSENPIGYMAISQVQFERKDYDAALENIKRAVKIDQKNPDIWKRYVQLRIDGFHASNDEISALYSDAVNKTEYHIDIISAYASWLRNAGNLQASKEYWQKAIEINPSNKKAYEAEIKVIDVQLKAQG